MNLLKEFRTKLELSRPQLAELLGRSKEIIERYESEVSQDLARELAALAKSKGMADWERRWLIEAGDQRDNREINLEQLSSQEQELVSILVTVLRDPQSPMQAMIPALLRDIEQYRTQYSKKRNT